MRYYFPRPMLAQQLVAQLTGKDMFNDAASGLFLAAPRRTGKSTFLKNDLQPALEAEGHVVIYVDLWADKKRDPGVLIADVIAAELKKHLGVVAKTAKSAGLTSIGIGNWLKVDTSKIGTIDGLTLADALRALHETSNKTIALIIDEAQHALTTDAGDNAMTALKSARDQLNTPADVNLMLIMSGSDRDKLMRLVNSNAAPFFGSKISHMPVLGREFIAAVAERITATYPHLSPVDNDKLWEAFELFSFRPEPFMGAVGEVINPLSETPPTTGFVDRILELTVMHRKDQESAMESAFLGLKRTEQVVLWRMLQQKSRFRPYDAEALAFYKEKAGKRITAQMAQTALEQLREQSPALVWKSSKREYSLDDTAMYQWYDNLVADGKWPPIDPNADEAAADDGQT